MTKEELLKKLASRKFWCLLAGYNSAYTFASGSIIKVYGIWA